MKLSLLAAFLLGGFVLGMMFNVGAQSIVKPKTSANVVRLQMQTKHMSEPATFFCIPASDLIPEGPEAK